MKPIIKIGGQNGTDISNYLVDMKPELNDLDKDGSGRNILDGEMYRTKIADKFTFNLQFVDLYEDEMVTIHGLFTSPFVNVYFLNPNTNTYIEKTFYYSKFSYGQVRYKAYENKTIYYQPSVQLIER